MTFLAFLRVAAIGHLDLFSMAPAKGDPRCGVRMGIVVALITRDLARPPLIVLPVTTPAEDLVGSLGDGSMDLFPIRAMGIQCVTTVARDKGAPPFEILSVAGGGTTDLPFFSDVGSVGLEPVLRMGIEGMTGEAGRGAFGRGLGVMTFETGTRTKLYGIGPMGGGLLPFCRMGEDGLGEAGFIRREGGAALL